jgi:predicted NBD/HSP70 family sugar kinase
MACLYILRKTAKYREIGTKVILTKSSNIVAGHSLNTHDGVNQTGVRAHNEKLILTLLRRHGSLPKSEIARRSGLTPQTVSVIMRSLEKDGLLLRGAPQRGKVGQPSIPMSLNPKGAFSIGLKVGRRSAELVLVDFLGQKLRKLSLTYHYPLPVNLLNFTRDGIETLTNELSPSQQQRIAGIGVATPFELWNWAEKIDAPESEMKHWRNFDFYTELSALVDYPVFVQNDGTAACGSELIFGRGSELSDFVYLFIGTFIGGGVVLNHSVYSGRTGNAGAFGPMPVVNQNNTSATLIDFASIFTLETRLKEMNLTLPTVGSPAEVWLALGEPLESWVDEASTHLANAIVASCALIDFEAAVIDGAFPDKIREMVVHSIRVKITNMDTRGINSPKILEGSVGEDARALGAASQSLLSKFLLNQSVLFKPVS